MPHSQPTTISKHKYSTQHIPNNNPNKSSATEVVQSTSCVTIANAVYNSIAAEISNHQLQTDQNSNETTSRVNSRIKTGKQT